MSVRRIALLVFLLVLAPTRGPVANAAADPERIATAVRTVMALDRYPTLVTLDADGRPRARTVEVSAPDEQFVLWMATRPSTRKVAQIQGDPRVTVHFAADDAGAYVSVMGRATLHDDAATVAAHTFQAPEDLARFWPDYPSDYLLIRIEPEWIEVLGAGIEADASTWRPQRLDP